MAVPALARPRIQAVSSGYRRLLVPIAANGESERAVATACRIAAERHASVTVMTVIEVPTLLPLDARMDEEELEARRLQRRAQEIADAYGVPMNARRLRARQAGSAVVEELEQYEFDLVVLGAPRANRPNKRGVPFGRTVQQVLHRAPCRVLVLAPAAA